MSGQDLAGQLAMLGFDEPGVAASLSKSGVREVIQLVDMNEMEIRECGGVNFGKARKLLALAKGEQQRDMDAAEAQARIDAMAARGMSDAALEERARIVGALNQGGGDNDTLLVRILNESNLLFKVGPLLIEEGLLTFDDVVSVSEKTLVELGIEEIVARKFHGLCMSVRPVPRDCFPQDEEASKYA
jgi:hypothetical protein